MELPNLPDWLKISSTHLFAIAAAAAVLLFSPLPVLSALGLAQFVAYFRMWIGFALLICGAVLVARGLASVIALVKTRSQRSRMMKRKQARLHKLTPDEATVLAGYLGDETRTQYFQLTNGVVQGLLAEGIVFRVSTEGSWLRGFAYNIQPWAMDYLTAHPELVAHARNTRVDEGSRF